VAGGLVAGGLVAGGLVGGGSCPIRVLAQPTMGRPITATATKAVMTAVRRVDGGMLDLTDLGSGNSDRRSVDGTRAGERGPPFGPYRLVPLGRYQAKGIRLLLDEWESRIAARWHRVHRKLRRLAR